MSRRHRKYDKTANEIEEIAGGLQNSGNAAKESEVFAEEFTEGFDLEAMEDMEESAEAAEDIEVSAEEVTGDAEELEAIVEEMAGGTEEAGDEATDEAEETEESDEDAEDEVTDEAEESEETEESDEDAEDEVTDEAEESEETEESDEDAEDEVTDEAEESEETEESDEETEDEADEIEEFDEESDEESEETEDEADEIEEFDEESNEESEETEDEADEIEEFDEESDEESEETEDEADEIEDADEEVDEDDYLDYDEDKPRQKKIVSGRTAVFTMLLTGLFTIALIVGGFIFATTFPKDMGLSLVSYTDKFNACDTNDFTYAAMLGLDEVSYSDADITLSPDDRKALSKGKTVTKFDGMVNLKADVRFGKLVSMDISIDPAVDESEGASGLYMMLVGNMLSGFYPEQIMNSDECFMLAYTIITYASPDASLPENVYRYQIGDIAIDMDHTQIMESGKLSALSYHIANANPHYLDTSSVDVSWLPWNKDKEQQPEDDDFVYVSEADEAPQVSDGDVTE